MAQVRPGLLLGGEARYFRQFDGVGLDELAGQALFVGPTAYFQLSERGAHNGELELPDVGPSDRHGCCP
jgi:hypothetical protein